MIVAITCRNGTDSGTRRNEVNRELLALSKYDADIARAKVIFSKHTHHKNADDLVTCHLCIALPNRHQVDIYEEQPAEMQAFERAKERAIAKIRRSSPSRHPSHKRFRNAFELPPALESEAIDTGPFDNEMSLVNAAEQAQ